MLGRLCNLTVVHFNPQKREFSPLLNTPVPPPVQCWDITEQLRATIKVLLNTGPGAGGGRKKEVKKATFPTLLDDDCSYNKELAINVFVEHCNKSEVFPIDTDL